MPARKSIGSKKTAKTVTHIMGLRAFTSLLLCEQVGFGRWASAVSMSPSDLPGKLALGV